MGTNFYLFTGEKEKKRKYACELELELTDEPALGYVAHIAKTSSGWLPLFQEHNGVKSVSDIKKLYDDGFQIVDDYNDTYDWPAFDKRVLQFNGGVRGAIPPTKYDQSGIPAAFIDMDMPNHTPVIHFEYAGGRYSDLYFTDGAGYEFMTEAFR